MPKTFIEYKDITPDTEGTLTIGKIKGVPDITADTLGEPMAWFLGPNGENRELLAAMINKGLGDACDFRANYPVNEPDPDVINEKIKQSPAYQKAVAEMLRAHDDLCTYLSTYSTPYSSMRYQGHMLWDNTLPALAGYFAAMMHNPNNVTIEASTSTTPLGIMVGWDLCKMIGFSFREHGAPWAHITADGSIANIEAAWATRECKLLPLALRQLVKNELRQALSLPIAICDTTTVLLSEASAWQLLNMRMDDVLALPSRIAAHCGLSDEWEVWNRVEPYSLNSVGWSEIMALTADVSGEQLPIPVTMTPSTKHYSWPKAAAVCGYGHKQSWNVLVDADGRMKITDDTHPSHGAGDVAPLNNHLQYCLEHHIPVAQVVVVTGTTEEGAVDPVKEVLELREHFRTMGLDFCIHVDAAWGGYLITSIRKDYRLTATKEARRAEINSDISPYDANDIFINDVSATNISDYVIEQYQHIRHCDSVTIDPHKMGYVQYPAGSISYRNGLIRRLTTFTGAYIGGAPGSLKPGEPTVGIFGIEGSKPGAAAAAVFLSHRVIRPSVGGHGKIISESMFNTKMFYWYLVLLGMRSSHYEVVPLKPENTEHAPRFLADIEQSSLREALRSPKWKHFFRNAGPDLNICDYIFNPINEKGVPNSDWDQLNLFTNAVYDIFHVKFASPGEATTAPEPISKFPKFMLTKTTFERSEYGDEFLDTFAQRIGLPEKKDGLNCLRSVVMDPYMPYTEQGDFFDQLMRTIDHGVIALVKHWRRGTGPFHK